MGRTMSVAGDPVDRRVGRQATRKNIHSAKPIFLALNSQRQTHARRSYTESTSRIARRFSEDWLGRHSTRDIHRKVIPRLVLQALQLSATRFGLALLAGM
ncbi:hypothetical protein OF001_U20009 [Pseudomonas sp. OF001]|nr:hypothetical protein OF001_U20009 [Pseudomonas sp. OF001]